MDSLNYTSSFNSSRASSSEESFSSVVSDRVSKYHDLAEGLQERFEFIQDCFKGLTSAMEAQDVETLAARGVFSVSKVKGLLKAFNEAVKELKSIGTDETYRMHELHAAQKSLFENLMEEIDFRKNESSDSSSAEESKAEPTVKRDLNLDFLQSQLDDLSNYINKFTSKQKHEMGKCIETMQKLGKMIMKQTNRIPFLSKRSKTQTQLLFDEIISSGQALQKAL